MRYVRGQGTDLREETRLLEDFTREPTFPLFYLDVLYAAPARPVAGLVVYADGVTWNPGAGEGIYRYNLAGAWVLVG